MIEVIKSSSIIKISFLFLVMCFLFMLAWAYSLSPNLFNRISKNYTDLIKAHMGVPESQRQLAYMYKSGAFFGISQDSQKALYWYRKAAEQNHGPALSDLAYMHSIGDFVPKDLSESVRLYTLSAEQGEPYAQYNLARHHIYGVGVEHDLAKAKSLLEASAGQGNKDAKKLLEDVKLMMFLESEVKKINSRN